MKTGSSVLQHSLHNRADYFVFCYFHVFRIICWGAGAERRRPDDAARIAEPRAALGNGCGDRRDGAGSRRRAFLSPFAALPALWQIFG
ncbi:hypothetical protein R6Z07M_019368 [Ovis aries]